MHNSSVTKFIDSKLLTENVLSKCVIIQSDNMTVDCMHSSLCCITAASCFARIPVDIVRLFPSQFNIHST